MKMSTFFYKYGVDKILQNDLYFYQITTIIRIIREGIRRVVVCEK